MLSCIENFDCEKFVSCSGVELASKDNRVLIVNVQNEDGQIINSKIIN